jgi:hypothetical protein
MPEEQRTMFVSRPCATKGKTSPNLHAEKTFFRANSDSECSACRSGLLTYILPPCTPSPLANRCQLVLPAPLPLAHKLIHAAARRLCPGCPVPDTFCAATAAAAVPVASFALISNSRRQPVPPASDAPPRTYTAAAALFPLSPAAHASAVDRGPCPGYRAPGTPYVTAAATPVAALISQPSGNQPLPPAALPGTSNPHCQLSPPPQGRLRAFF